MTSPGTDADDQQDMARLAGGEDRALNDLMDRHGERLFHFLLRWMQNAAAAEDLAQETFVRIYLHRRRFNPRHKFTSWLFTIATNLARDRHRWLARHPQVSLESEIGTTEIQFSASLAARIPDPSDQMQSQERAAAVRRAIAALPEELRVPLLLAEYESHSQADIAVILGCSVKAVEMRLYRARIRLREQLQPLMAAL